MGGQVFPVARGVAAVRTAVRLDIVVPILVFLQRGGQPETFRTDITGKRLGLTVDGQMVGEMRHLHIAAITHRAGVRPLAAVRANMLLKIGQIPKFLLTRVTCVQCVTVRFLVSIQDAGVRELLAALRAGKLFLAVDRFQVASKSVLVLQNFATLCTCPRTSFFRSHIRNKFRC